MKALVTQFNASGEPPNVWAIAGRATAGPVKLTGIDSPARQTAAKINSFSVALCVSTARLRILESSNEVSVSPRLAPGVREPLPGGEPPRRRKY
jgi:hypothetical protein